MCAPVFASGQGFLMLLQNLLANRFHGAGSQSAPGGKDNAFAACAQASRRDGRSGRRSGRRCSRKPARRDRVHACGDGEAGVVPERSAVILEAGVVDLDAFAAAALAVSSTGSQLEGVAGAPGVAQNIDIRVLEHGAGTCGCSAPRCRAGPVKRRRARWRSRRRSGAAGTFRRRFFRDGSDPGDLQNARWPSKSTISISVPFHTRTPVASSRGRTFLVENGLDAVYRAAPLSERAMVREGDTRAGRPVRRGGRIPRRCCRRAG